MNKLSFVDCNFLSMVFTSLTYTDIKISPCHDCTRFVYRGQIILQEIVVAARYSMKNPPLTYYVNIMNLCTLISGYSRMMVPINLSILLPASIMSHFRRDLLAKKYLEGKEGLLPIVDLCTHWLPSTLILAVNRKKRIRRRDVMVGAILPWVYFSMGQKTKSKFHFVNPVGHLLAVYPGVPMCVFSMYYGTLALLYGHAMKTRRKIMYE